LVHPTLLFFHMYAISFFFLKYAGIPGILHAKIEAAFISLYKHTEMNMNNFVIPANPIPLMPLNQQLAFDNALAALENLPLYECIQARFVLMNRIDCKILIENMPNMYQNVIMNLENNALNVILMNNAKEVVDNIMEIVLNSTHNQRIHIYNRVMAVMRN